MIVIRLSKKSKKTNFFYINVIFKKNSVHGKIIKRIGYYDPLINIGKKFFIDFFNLFKYVKNGAKISKRVFEILKI